MVDGLIIFVMGIFIVVEVRRGAFLAGVDLAGLIIATKMVRLWQLPVGNFLAAHLPFSERASFILAALLIFLGIAAIFSGLAIVVHSMTLLTAADVFEQIFSFCFALFGAGTLVHFILLLVMTYTGSEAVKNAVSNSFLGYQLFSLELYHQIMLKLKPLTEPGELYL